MKKNLLAASLALALGSMSGVASAALEVNTNGVGQINVLPYYSVQDSYNTLMTITNTDEVNGKVVKVRFRAAEWSDDALDFQIFLSPADVWTGAFGIVDGKLVLKTSDKSCTLPAALDGQEFTTIRVEGGNVDSLKEGYVEIITMADIPPKLNGADPTDAGNTANPLFTAVKHVNGIAPCGATVAGLVENSTRIARPGTVADDATAVVAAAANAQGSWMLPPSSSLTSSATVIAVNDSKAFTVPGTAITGLLADFPQVQYFRQSNTSFTFANNAAADLLTADRLFWPQQTADQEGAAYPVYQFDLPDLSTPFAPAGSAVARRNLIAQLLQKSTLATDYVIAPSIQASTDIVLSQPVRRYFYTYTEVADPAVAGVDYNRTIRGEKFDVAGEVGTPYHALTIGNKVEVGAPTFWDREEQTFVSADDIVVSPQEPGEAAKYFLEGEVSVVSIKNGEGATGALGASLTNVDWSFAQSYTSGWAKLNTVAQGIDPADLVAPYDVAGTALPLIGFTAINIFNAGAGAAGTNYGQVLPLRVSGLSRIQCESGGLRPAGACKDKGGLARLCCFCRL
ncbi:hypothetical protein [Thauera humireducens]|uniref:hypothetical protein n=1 Tax=Thauera humireducens TaxID=1134435 RepID=UPI00311ED774